jgi:hypothetical protein
MGADGDKAGDDGRHPDRVTRRQPAVEAAVVRAGPLAEVRRPPHGGELPGALSLLADDHIPVRARRDRVDVDARSAEHVRSRHRVPGDAVG